MTIHAGAARIDVDVPPGTAMAGFAARTGPSEGVHDPLSVRALVLGDVALVTLDVCAVHERTAVQIGDALTDVVGTCVVTATHTHSGPCVALGRLGLHEPAVHDAVVQAAADAVRTAVARQVGCDVWYGETAGLGIAKNRRHRDRRADPPAQGLRFVDAAGGTVAWLVTYPCHPVVLDAANRLISGDYVAVVRDRIEARTPGALCVFATGAAGDMNTGHRVEDSYDPGTSPRRTFGEAARVGGVVADAVADALVAAPARRARVDAVSAATRKRRLALERVRPEQALAERDVWRDELRSGATAQRETLLQAWIGWADELLSGTYDAVGDGWEASVTAVALGDVMIVALPGEPFLGSAERLARVHDGPTLVLGYANGCPGYFPPAEEYAHGGYEVVDAHRYYGMPGPFAAGSAELLEEAAVEAMDAVRR